MHLDPQQAARKAAAMATKPLPPARTDGNASPPEPETCPACGTHIDAASLLCGCNNR